MGQVLVLNASYEPLNITSWRRATVLMLKGKAESLEEDSAHNIRQDVKAPTVIRLRHFIRVPYREIPLSRKLSIQTAYEVSSGQVDVLIRMQNRSMETLRDVMLKPWMPPGYLSHSIPLIERLDPDEVGIVRMPLSIDMGEGGEFQA